VQRSQKETESVQPHNNKQQRNDSNGEHYSLEECLDFCLFSNLLATLAVGTLDRGVGTRFEELFHGIGVILIQRIQQCSVAKVVLDIDLLKGFF
jgi:hypothetical protein